MLRKTHGDVSRLSRLANDLQTTNAGCQKNIAAEQEKNAKLQHEIVQLHMRMTAERQALEEALRQMKNSDAFICPPGPVCPICPAAAAAATEAEEKDEDKPFNGEEEGEKPLPKDSKRLSPNQIVFLFIVSLVTFICLATVFVQSCKKCYHQAGLIGRIGRRVASCTARALGITSREEESAAAAAANNAEAGQTREAAVAFGCNPPSVELFAVERETRGGRVAEAAAAAGGGGAGAGATPRRRRTTAAPTAKKGKRGEKKVRDALEVLEIAAEFQRIDLANAEANLKALNLEKDFDAARDSLASIREGLLKLRGEIAENEPSPLHPVIQTTTGLSPIEEVGEEEEQQEEADAAPAAAAVATPTPAAAAATVTVEDQEVGSGGGENEKKK